jgi:pilus assembly protein FimV
LYAICCVLVSVAVCAVAGGDDVLRRFIAVLAIALLSVRAWADFGPIHVYSRLGEPLRAEVPLTNTDAMSGSRWHVGLADRAAFDDLNVIYTPELADLRFSLFAGPNGPVVLIRSRKPVRAPYLQFVLQLQSESGHWVQSFEVRLESRAEDDVIEVPAETAAPAKQAAAKTRGAKPPAVKGLTVGAHDTLASLAAKIRPSGVQPSQAMAALYLANRAKFDAGVPPVPRPGSRLTVPGAAAMRAISMAHAEAVLHPPAHFPPLGTLPPLASLTASAPDKARPVAAPKPAPAASQPKAATPPLAASQAAAYAASEAAARTQINTLQQQVTAREQDLHQADQHIATLKHQIQSLQASQAATAKLLANGLNYRNPRVLAIGGGVALLIAVLSFLLGRRRGPGNGKKKTPKAAKNPLATTGVAQPDPKAAEADGKGDPLAEAEVYLAYGHDEQAEDILTKALAQHPGRQDIRAKLLEIYAARPDTVKFEVLAHEVHDAYDGRGAQWERTRAMGAGIDPQNPLYRAEVADTATPMMDFSTLETPAAEEALDFSMTEAEPEAAAPATEENSLLDFDFSLDGKPAPDMAPAGAVESSPLEGDGMAEPAAEPAADLAWPEEASELAPEPVLSAAPEPVEAAMAEPELEAALAAMPEPALEMDAEPALAATPADVTVEDIDLPPSQEEEALATKLDLAQVYLDMGDNDGAREVLHELIGEAKGKLRQQAEDMLARVTG